MLLHNIKTLVLLTLSLSINTTWRHRMISPRKILIVDRHVWEYQNLKANIFYQEKESYDGGISRTKWKLWNRFKYYIHFHGMMKTKIPLTIQNPQVNYNVNSICILSNVLWVQIHKWSAIYKCNSRKHTYVVLAMTQQRQ